MGAKVELYWSKKMARSVKSTVQWNGRKVWDNGGGQLKERHHENQKLWTNAEKNSSGEVNVESIR